MKTGKEVGCALDAIRRAAAVRVLRIASALCSDINLLVPENTNVGEVLSAAGRSETRCRACVRT
jgi:hypothetical protein